MLKILYTKDDNSKQMLEMSFYSNSSDKMEHYTLENNFSINYDETTGNVDMLSENQNIFIREKIKDLSFINKTTSQTINNESVSISALTTKLGKVMQKNETANIIAKFALDYFLKENPDFKASDIFDYNGDNNLLKYEIIDDIIKIWFDDSISEYHRFSLMYLLEIMKYDISANPNLSITTNEYMENSLHFIFNGGTDIIIDGDKIKTCNKNLHFGSISGGQGYDENDEEGNPKYKFDNFVIKNLKCFNLNLMSTLRKIRIENSILLEGYYMYAKDYEIINSKIENGSVSIYSSFFDYVQYSDEFKNENTIYSNIIMHDSILPLVMINNYYPTKDDKKYYNKIDMRNSKFTNGFYLHHFNFENPNTDFILKNCDFTKTDTINFNNINFGAQEKCDEIVKEIIDGGFGISYLNKKDITYKLFEHAIEGKVLKDSYYSLYPKYVDILEDGDGTTIYGFKWNTYDADYSNPWPIYSNMQRWELCIKDDLTSIFETLNATKFPFISMYNNSQNVNDIENYKSIKSIDYNKIKDQLINGIDLGGPFSDYSRNTYAFVIPVKDPRIGLDISNSLKLYDLTDVIECTFESTDCDFTPSQNLIDKMLERGITINVK